MEVRKNIGTPRNEIVQDPDNIIILLPLSSEEPPTYSYTSILLISAIYLKANNTIYVVMYVVMKLDTATAYSSYI